MIPEDADAAPCTTCWAVTILDHSPPCDACHIVTCPDCPPHDCPGDTDG